MFLQILCLGYFFIIIKIFFTVISVITAVSSYLDLVDIIIILFFFINSKLIKENKLIKNYSYNYNINFLKVEIYYVFYSIYFKS